MLVRKYMGEVDIFLNNTPKETEEIAGGKL